MLFTNIKNQNDFGKEKKVLKLLSICVVSLCVVFCLDGCAKKLKTVSYTDKKTNIKTSISFDEEANYTLSEDSNDLRTTRENAILLGDDFKISMEYNSLSSGQTMDYVKDVYKKYEDYKEITFNEIKGYSMYNASYVRYDVALPASNKVYVVFHVYSNDSKSKKDDVKKLYESEKIKEILNTVKFETSN